jgi:RNA polymerase sigma-70 factor (ECF subfamily)
MTAAQGPSGLDGLRELYEARAVQLVAILTIAAGNYRAEAEDVVQEAFARLVPRWSVVSRYDDPEAWVRSVAFRLLSNRLRQSRNSAKAILRLGHQRPPTLPPPVDADIAVALRRLPLPQRQVLVLHHLLDLSIEVVAAELRLPEGTVKSRLARGREALAPFLMETADDHA